MGNSGSATFFFSYKRNEVRDTITNPEGVVFLVPYRPSIPKIASTRKKQKINTVK